MNEQTKDELLKRHVEASLDFDYTTEGDNGGDYETEQEEHEAAVANVVEMHRLLNLRAERLGTVYEEFKMLRAVVDEFCVERAGFITAINNCHPDNVSDYHRWQGHAEARRQLSERLGLPTAWPATTQASEDQT